MVGLAKSFVARLVPGNEPVGVDHCGKAIGGLRGGVAAPGQGVDGTSPFHRLFGPVIGLQEREVKILKMSSVGKRVADEHAVGSTHGQGQGGEEDEVGLVDIMGPCSVGKLHSLAKAEIQRMAVLADDPSSE